MRPTLDQYLMGLASLAAMRTTCIRRAVGCVLANSRGHVLAIGYNGVASGQPHCNERHSVPVYHDDPRVESDGLTGDFVFGGETVKRFSDAFLQANGNRQCVGFDQVALNACQGHHLPPGQDSCEAVHAEQNALLQCKDPWDIETAYVTTSPCKPCVKLLMNTSCKRIVFLQEIPDTWPRDQWLKLGRRWERMDPVLPLYADGTLVPECLKQSA